MHKTIIQLSTITLMISMSCLVYANQSMFSRKPIDLRAELLTIVLNQDVVNRCLRQIDPNLQRCKISDREQKTLDNKLRNWRGIRLEEEIPGYNSAVQVRLTPNKELYISVEYPNDWKPVAENNYMIDYDIQEHMRENLEAAFGGDGIEIEFILLLPVLEDE